MTVKSPKAERVSTQTSGRKTFRQRPILSLPQLLILAALVAAILIGLDLNRRAQRVRQIEENEMLLQDALELEKTRQVELQATRDYVNSEDYVAAYARDEAGQLLPGERRVVPLLPGAVSAPTAVPAATPDPAYDARAWQAWWRLLSDAPLPAP